MNGFASSGVDFRIGSSAPERGVGIKPTVERSGTVGHGGSRSDIDPASPRRGRRKLPEDRAATSLPSPPSGAAWLLRQSHPQFRFAPLWALFRRPLRGLITDRDSYLLWSLSMTCGAGPERALAHQEFLKLQSTETADWGLDEAQSSDHTLHTVAAMWRTPPSCWMGSSLELK